MRLAALSDDFNFEARIGASESGRHVPERQGMVDAVAKGTRSHPSYGLAVMPDRLIADSVGVGRVDFEGHQPQRAAALLLSGAAAALLLSLLDIFRSRFTPVALRTAADLALLTPLLLAPFFK